MLKKPGAGRRDRTDILSLEGCCTTIVLYPRGDCGSSRGTPQPILSGVLIRRVRKARGGGRRTRTFEAYAGDLQSPPFAARDIPPTRLFEPPDPSVPPLFKRDETKAFGMSPPLQ